MKAVFPVVVALFLLSLVSFSEAAPLRVTELAVTTKVSKGKPIDAVHRIYNRSVRALYGFTRTQSDPPQETTVTHIWLRGGHKVKEVTMPVKGRRWRLYSTLAVDASSIGSWRLEVRDAAGQLLKAADFQIH
ncbi:MAG: DUF2914 domain-containing protein [Trichlorobacter sp.]|jgi:hypothetical protein